MVHFRHLGLGVLSELEGPRLATRVIIWGLQVGCRLQLLWVRAAHRRGDTGVKEGRENSKVYCLEL